MQTTLNRYFLYREDFYIFSSAVFLLLLSSVIPIVALYSGMILLALSGSAHDVSRRLLGLVVIFSGSVVYSSREVFVTASDDLFIYYDTYIEAVNGDWLGVIEKFSNGFEVFLSLFFIVLSVVFGYLPPHHLLFILTFSVAVGFFVWLEMYGLKYVNHDLKALCMASTLILFSFGFLGQVVRQSQASIFILFALSQGGILRRYVFLGLATTCHLTSPIIYFFLKTIMSDRKKTKIIIVGALSVFSFSFQYFLEPLIANDWTGLLSVLNKAHYYRDMADGFTVADMANVKFILIGLMAAVFFSSKEHQDKQWNSLLLYGGICYLVLLPYPLVPIRTMLIYSVFLMGYLLFFSFRKKLMLYQVFLTIYALYAFINKIQMLKPSGGGFDLWYSFPWFESVPFYYFLN